MITVHARDIDEPSCSCEVLPPRAPMLFHVECQKRNEAYKTKYSIVVRDFDFAADV